MTAGQAYFQRALDVARVFMINISRRDWIDLEQARIKFVERECLKLSPEPGGGSGYVVWPMSKELEIESGSTYDYREFSPCADALNDRKGHCSILASVQDLRGICNAIEMVSCEEPILFTG